MGLRYGERPTPHAPRSTPSCPRRFFGLMVAMFRARAMRSTSQGSHYAGMPEDERLAVRNVIYFHLEIHSHPNSTLRHPDIRIEMQILTNVRTLRA